MATSNQAVDSMGELLADLTIYKRIGTTEDGRTHHYDCNAHQVVVCSADRSTPGISDEDIEQRMDVPENSTGAWDYIKFVSEDTDHEWAETDVPEERR